MSRGIKLLLARVLCAVMIFQSVAVDGIYAQAAENESNIIVESLGDEDSAIAADVIDESVTDDGFAVEVVQDETETEEATVIETETDSDMTDVSVEEYSRELLAEDETVTEEPVTEEQVGDYYGEIMQWSDIPGELGFEFNCHRFEEIYGDTKAFSNEYLLECINYWKVNYNGTEGVLSGARVELPKTGSGDMEINGEIFDAVVSLSQNPRISIGPAFGMNYMFDNIGWYYSCNDLSKRVSTTYKVAYSLTDKGGMCFRYTGDPLYDPENEILSLTILGSEELAGFYSGATGEIMGKFFYVDAKGNPTAFADGDFFARINTENPIDSFMDFQNVTAFTDEVTPIPCGWLEEDRCVNDEEDTMTWLQTGMPVTWNDSIVWKALYGGNLLEINGKQIRYLAQGEFCVLGTYTDNNVNKTVAVMGHIDNRIKGIKFIEDEIVVEGKYENNRIGDPIIYDAVHPYYTIYPSGADYDRVNLLQYEYSIVTPEGDVPFMRSDTVVFGEDDLRRVLRCGSDDDVLAVGIDRNGHYTDEFYGLRAGEVTLKITLYQMDGDSRAKDNEGKDVILSTDTVIVKVKDPVPVIDNIPDDYYPNDLVALVGVDQTLADIDLSSYKPIEGLSWKFKDPGTSIAKYAKNESCDFPAICVLDLGNGKKYELETVITVSIFDLSKMKTDIVVSNELSYLTYRIADKVCVGDTFTAELAERPDDYARRIGRKPEIEAAVQNRFDSGELKIVWTTDIPYLEASSEEEQTEYAYQCENTYILPGKDSEDATNKANYLKNIGKHTITASIMAGNKAIKQFKTVITIFGDGVLRAECIEYPQYDEENGCFIIRQIYEDSYYKVKKVKVSDAKIAKAGKPEYVEGSIEETKYVDIKIPVTRVGYGNVGFEFTFDDAAATTLTAEKLFVDYIPKAIPSKTTINIMVDEDSPLLYGQLWAMMPSDGSLELTDAQKSAMGKPSLAGADKDKFELKTGNYFFGSGEEYMCARVVIAPVDDNLKKGNYNVGLLLNYYDANRDLKQITINYKISVVAQAPKVTAKVTKKYNEYYTAHTSEECENGNAEITIRVPDMPKDITLTGASDFEVDDWYMTGSNSAVVVTCPKEGVSTVSNFNDTLEVTLEGYKPIKVPVKITKESKAPKITMERKSDTLYTYAGIMETTVGVVDDNGSYYGLDDSADFGIDPDAAKISYVAKSGKVAIGSEEKAVDTGKNSYKVSLAGGKLRIKLDPSAKPVKADKMTFEVTPPYGTKAVTVNYSISVAEYPEISVVANKLNINKNAAAYKADVAVARVSLKDSVQSLEGDNFSVTVTGADKTTIQALSDGIVYVEAYPYEGDHSYAVNVGFNSKPSAFKAKKLSFNVNASYNGYSNMTGKFTVSVIDKAPAKCITAKMKGSIDVLDRENSCITVTAKNTGLNGEIVYSYLEGDDARLFEAYNHGDKMEIYAAPRAALYLSRTYTVTPVYKIASRHENITVKGTPLKIKVKQGKPKVVVENAKTPNDITYANNYCEYTVTVTDGLRDLYMDKITADNTKEFSCDAGIVWEKKDASFKMLPQASVDLVPSAYGYNSLKVGKTYSIKVKIYLRDAALDSKPIETTIKVKVSEKPGLIIS